MLVFQNKLGKLSQSTPSGKAQCRTKATELCRLQKLPRKCWTQSCEEAMMLERENGSRSPLERISSETGIFFLQTIMAPEHGKLISPSRLTLHTRLSSCRQCLGVLVILGTHGREALAGASFPDFSFVQRRAQKEQGCVLISALCSEGEGEAGTPWSVIWLPCSPPAVDTAASIPQHRRQAPGMPPHHGQSSGTEAYVFYYAGRKHGPHRNVTCSMTDESAEVLNLARHSQPLGRSQTRPLPLCWGSAQAVDPERRRSGDGAACQEGCFCTLRVQQEEVPCET